MDGTGRGGAETTLAGRVKDISTVIGTASDTFADDTVALAATCTVGAGGNTSFPGSEITAGATTLATTGSTDALLLSAGTAGAPDDAGLGSAAGVDAEDGFEASPGLADSAACLFACDRCNNFDFNSDGFALDASFCAAGADCADCVGLGSTTGSSTSLFANSSSRVSTPAVSCPTGGTTVVGRMESGNVLLVTAWLGAAVVL